MRERVNGWNEVGFDDSTGNWRGGRWCVAVSCELVMEMRELLEILKFLAQSSTVGLHKASSQERQGGPIGCWCVMGGPTCSCPSTKLFALQSEDEAEI